MDLLKTIESLKLAHRRFASVIQFVHDSHVRLAAETQNAYTAIEAALQRHPIEPPK